MDVGLQTMYKLCNPADFAAGGEEPTALATAMKYLHTIVMATSKTKLNERDAREFQTLATALDLLANGKPGAVGDLLIQRFKGLETTVRDEHGALGRRQELIPDLASTVTSGRERELALKELLREAKMRDAIAKHRH